MYRNDIVDALMTATKGQAFITASQLAKAMGRSDQRKVQKSFLDGLEAVNGKYYLIRDVASVLKEKCTM